MATKQKKTVRLTFRLSSHELGLVKDHCAALAVSTAEYIRIAASSPIEKLPQRECTPRPHTRAITVDKAAADFFKSEAARLSVSMSHYLHAMALRPVEVIPFSTTSCPSSTVIIDTLTWARIYLEKHRIGVNLNQAVKALNQINIALAQTSLSKADADYITNRAIFSAEALNTIIPMYNDVCAIVDEIHGNAPMLLASKPMGERVASQ
jgi:hypothetical protein